MVDSPDAHPGPLVDCELPYYGFSDPKIWGTWNWTERSPDHYQLRDYFDHVAQVWDLNQHRMFNTQVMETRWDEDEKKWLTKTKQHIPDFPGKDWYKEQFHLSALRPEDIKIDGKKLAVIGAGSSGVQIPQETAKARVQTTQFFRTPNIAVPMRQRQISEQEILSHKCLLPHV